MHSLLFWDRICIVCVFLACLDVIAEDLEIPTSSGARDSTDKFNASSGHQGEQAEEELRGNQTHASRFHYHRGQFQFHNDTVRKYNSYIKFHKIQIEYQVNDSIPEEINTIKHHERDMKVLIAKLPYHKGEMKNHEAQMAYHRRFITENETLASTSIPFYKRFMSNPVVEGGCG